MAYAWEKFNGAIRTLAGTGSIQNRLADAYVNLTALDPDKLPLKIREDFRKLGEDLTRVQAKGDEGTIAATTTTMSDSEALEHIETIIRMYDEVVRYETKLIKN